MPHVSLLHVRQRAVLTGLTRSRNGKSATCSLMVVLPLPLLPNMTYVVCASTRNVRNFLEFSREALMHL